MIPGRALHWLAGRLCSDDFHHRVVEAQLADFQHEWARARGVAQRAMVLVRGYGAFWCSIGSWALRGLQREILDMSWRDAFPFPGVLAMVIILINLSERWVRAGTVWGARFDAIDTRLMWPMVLMALVQRYWPTLHGVRGFAIHAAMFYVAAMPLLYTDILREQMRGWIPFVIFLVAVTLAQPRKSRAPQG